VKSGTGQHIKSSPSPISGFVLIQGPELTATSGDEIADQSSSSRRPGRGGVIPTMKAELVASFDTMLQPVPKRRMVLQSHAAPRSRDDEQ
jgi:hypothetical protein